MRERENREAHKGKKKKSKFLILEYRWPNLKNRNLHEPTSVADGGHVAAPMAQGEGMKSLVLSTD